MEFDNTPDFVNVVSLTKDEFDFLDEKPWNYLFFVYEERIGDDGNPCVDISLYKGEYLVLGTDGVEGEKGNPGKDGNDGKDGESSIIREVSCSMLPNNYRASVTNTGSPYDSILHFSIPYGNKGEDGEKGKKGVDGKDFLFDDFTDEQLALLVGDKGNPGKDGKDGNDGDKGAKGDAALIKGLSVCVVENDVDISASISPVDGGFSFGLSFQKGETGDKGNRASNTPITCYIYRYETDNGIYGLYTIGNRHFSRKVNFINYSSETDFDVRGLYYDYRLKIFCNKSRISVGGKSIVCEDTFSVRNLIKRGDFIQFSVLRNCYSLNQEQFINE